MRRSLAAPAAVCALACLGAAGPARADDPSSELGLSRDGMHWTDGDLTRPIFPTSVRWVPGDVRTEHFFARNQAADSGRLEVDLTRVDRDALLDSGYLTISARAGDGAWTSVRAIGRHVLVTDDVAAGAVVPVAVRATLSGAAPNDTMLLSTDLDFDVRMTELDAVLGVNGSRGRGHHGSHGGFLADTGNVVRVWWPWVGLLLVGTGSFMMARHRERTATA